MAMERGGDDNLYPDFIDNWNFGFESLENLYRQPNLSVVCKNRPEFEALLHFEGGKSLAPV
jgi:hypothetical protein